MAKFTACRTRMSFHGFDAFASISISSSRNAAVRFLRTFRFESFASAAALSDENVPPSIAPVRSAATRDCSSARVFSVIASMYGWPRFQKLGLATYSTRSFGLKPVIRNGPVPIAFRLTLIWS